MTKGIRNLALLSGRVAILSVFVFVMIANAATKNPPPPPPSTSSTFATVYNVPNSFSAAGSISQTSSGGFVVGAQCDAGSTTPTCNGPATVLKVDSSGNIQSQTQYSYASAMRSTSLNINQPTSDGGAIFAGNPQFGCAAETTCAAIVKVDSTGKVQWVNDLQFADSSPETSALDIQQTTDGGFVLVGYTFAPGSIYNPWIAKLSSTGQIQWMHLLVDPKSDFSAAYSVRQTSDGGYLVAGQVSYVVTDSYTESEIALFKLDSTGKMVWQRNYVTGLDTYIQYMELTSDGGAIVSGTVYTSPGGNTPTSSALLMKVDSSGNVQFAKTFLPTGDIDVYSLTITGVQQTSDGGYAFSGYYFNYTVYTNRAWLVKTDSSGNVQWNKIYGPDVQYSDRYFNSFQQTSDGGFIAAGSTNQFNGGNGSIWLVKTDSSGNISGCTDVQNDSATTASVKVAVSHGNLSPVTDSFSWVADNLIESTAPLAATQE